MAGWGGKQREGGEVECSDGDGAAGRDDRDNSPPAWALRAGLVPEMSARSRQGLGGGGKPTLLLPERTDTTTRTRRRPGRWLRAGLLTVAEPAGCGRPPVPLRPHLPRHIFPSTTAGGRSAFPAREKRWRVRTDRGVVISATASTRSHDECGVGRARQFAVVPLGSTRRVRQLAERGHAARAEFGAREDYRL